MLVLAVHSYPGANDAVNRHWQFFEKSGAGKIIGIGTIDHGCRFPDGVECTNIGKNSYIEGAHLPQRLLDTLSHCLSDDRCSHIMVCEYDSLFFHPIDVEKMQTDLAAHHAGMPVWGSIAKSGFFHNPWLFTAAGAAVFCSVGTMAIVRGICGSGYPGAPESSPDVFFAYVAEKAGLPIQKDLWTEYSRNDLKEQIHLDEAREAYRNGVDIIHGIKTKSELDYIMA